MTKPTTERITSIDIFRGLMILTMIFVNDLASIHNIPAWMKHAPTEADTMTFVDLVFPAFLFIVGMAIPFAIQKRIDRGETTAHIWKHILIRTIGLIVLGVFMVNMESLNASATGISHSWWMLLLFIAAILVWNQYPKVADWKRIMVALLRFIGVIILIILAVIYRGGEGDQVHWMQTSWWGILGLIGWAYLTCCAVYFLFRKNLSAMIGILALFIALYIGDKNGKLDFLAPITNYIWLGGHIGGHSSITLSGVIIATLFLDGSPTQNHRSRMKWIAGFALMLFVAGYFLRPLYGISKNNATPTWCLYSSAICCLIFLALYWFVDLKGIEKWARFLKPAGENPLLAYILPDVFYALMGILGIKFLARYFGVGLVGIIRSLVFALLMLWVTGLLTKIKIRLHF
jgi:heparan-alpha-glucosaminide N-acetyltransferase